MLAEEVSISAAQGRPEGADAVAVARLDQDSRGVGGRDDIADDGAAADRGRLFVGADGDLVQAGQVDEDARASKVELACCPPVAAVLGDEADVLFDAVLDL